MNMNEFFTWHPSIIIASKSKKFKLVVFKGYANFKTDLLEYKVIIYNLREGCNEVEHEEEFYNFNRALNYFEGYQLE